MKQTSDTNPTAEAPVRKCPVMHGKNLDELFAGIKLPVEQPVPHPQSGERTCQNNCPGCPRKLNP